MTQTKSSPAFRRILGINFFSGNAKEAVDRLEDGGLLVVPAAPALKNLPHDPEYREALLQADLVITDSSFMVMLWNLLQRDSVYRLSGLAYLRELLDRLRKCDHQEILWIMPTLASARKNIEWLQAEGVSASEDDCYVAPIYSRPIEDETLLALLRDRRPKHLVVGLGGGTQERLGLYLRNNLGYSPAIHCIGAAIAFLSGDQVHIPTWADRFYLGWLFRCAAEPKRYCPRYWDARHLLSLLVRYRDELPELQVTEIFNSATIRIDNGLRASSGSD